MHVHRIIANVHVDDVDEAKAFYSGFLGLSHEEFTLGWVARYTSPESGAAVQLVTGDATAPEDSAISVLASDIDSAYEEAQRVGYEIVHPLTTEPWGVHRFMVRAPDGTVVNVVEHAD
jgi:predicted enzyme related to lactoylglutathione lyase